MEMIDPIFDPMVRKWFYGVVEANTLKMLLIKLGPKGAFGINNYYPCGCEVRHSGDDVIVTSFEPPTPKPLPIFIMKARSRRRGIPIISKYHAIRDEVLDMWAAGVSSQVIAEKFNITKITIAAHIVAPAREKGDPRAALRNPKKYKGAHQP